MSRPSLWRPACLAGFVLCLSGGQPVATPSAPAGEPSDRHVTATGVDVAMPEIARLSCAEMAEVLERIDASGYRGRELVPEGHPDHPLFLYEDRLAAAIYTGCTIRASRRAAPTEVFRHGFGAD